MNSDLSTLSKTQKAIWDLEACCDEVRNLFRNYRTLSNNSFPSGIALPGFTAGSVTFINAVLALAEDNANFFWNAALGRLGLGTNAPQERMHVYDSADEVGAEIETGADRNAFLKLTNTEREWRITCDTGVANSPLIFRDNTGAQNILTIANGGNVGIGTPTPNATLESYSTTEQLRLSYDSDSRWHFTVANGSELTAQPNEDSVTGLMFNDSAGNTVLNIDTTNQRIGINDTAPGYHLTIKSLVATSAKFLRMIDSTGTNMGEFSLDGSGNNRLFVLDTSGGTKIKLNTAGDSYFTGGNLGLNVTTPAALLELNQATATQVGAIFQTTDNSFTNNLVEYHDSGGAALGYRDCYGAVWGGNGAGNVNNSSANCYCVRGRMNPSGSYNSDRYFIGGWFSTLFGGTRTAGSMYCDGIQGNAIVESGATGAIARLRGLSFTLYNQSSGSNVTDIQCGYTQYSHRGSANQTNVYGWQFETAASGGSGPITNAYGLHVDTSAITSFVTNEYGVYQAGANAHNYFQGRILFGNDTTLADSNVWLQGSVDGAFNIFLTAYRNSSGQITFRPRYGRGTKSSPSIVQDNDLPFQLDVKVYDGTDFAHSIGTIRFRVDGTPGANDTPGRIQFMTTADGSSSATVNMTIRQDGSIEVNNDDQYIKWGGGQDCGICYDGTDMLFYANLVGSGSFKFKDNSIFIETIKSGATQAGAGAAAHEVWKTSSHATLPDNVLMIGV